jgi:ferredoxin--NADP+ reductase
VVFERNRLEGAPLQQSARGTGRYVDQPCGILFRSIGYRGIPIPGVPFDTRQGVFPSRDGRILDEGGTPIPGLYVAGWIKRGPTGIIGTNRADGVATVKTLLADLPNLDPEPKPGADALNLPAGSAGPRSLTWEDWLAIDQAEVARGEPKGKPREKFTRVAEMLNVLDRPS